MNFQEYQVECLKTAEYPDIGSNFVYPTLGLTGEAGEVSEKIKKVIRDNGGKVDGVRRLELKKELGDVMWYIAMLATELDINLNDIAETNIKKLKSRIERNVIKGDGDDR